jgi:hypothetical protein
MDSVCYAIKKNKELCNTNLTEKNKHKLKIEDKIYYVCGRHKKINNIEDIDISKYKVTEKIDDKEDVVNISNDKTNVEYKSDNIIKDFDKLNISSNEKDRIYTKKPCLQHIIYLISNDDKDICQIEDCQSVHNVNIVYT